MIEGNIFPFFRVQIAQSASVCYNIFRDSDYSRMGEYVMKLLIADDEELTREGLIASIEWGKFNITEIYQADDGVHGLELVKKHHPEIVLCDVRMPRMTGVEMVEKIQALYPDTTAIFMSGYSDKEYLKAAIKLQAISYVEKPLSIPEIEEALSEAINRCRMASRSRQNETKRKKGDASDLALSLTFPESTRNSEKNRVLFAELFPGISPDCVFTTWILKFPHEDLPEPAFMEQFTLNVTNHLQNFHMYVLPAEKHLQYMIFHVFGMQTPSERFLSDFENHLKILCQPKKAFYIARGISVSGIQNVYRSYADAAFLLQSSFFFDNGSVLTADRVKVFSGSVSDLSGFTKSFSDALESKDQKHCTELIQSLYAHYYQNSSLLPNDARDMYYRLFMLLEEARQHFHICSSASFSDNGNIMSDLEKCRNLQELSDHLREQTDAFFTGSAENQEDNSIVYMIREYISRNYSRESLSVKDISDHVFLSTSYVCTLFKSETGQTLNQYITEYRIAKAKELLRDPRYKITDIAGKVGYSDSNYFGKSFKKSVGLSPSEYRETMMS